MDKKIVIGLFLLALVLRWQFSFLEAHGDLITQTNWGRMADKMTMMKGFYEWKEWNGAYPNHPPLVSEIYYLLYPTHRNTMWFLSNLGNFIAIHRLAPTKFMWLYNFSIWYGTKLYGSSDVLFGVVWLLKMLMIGADLAIGGLILYLAKRAKANWMMFLGIYLFLPYSWYLSASWGQSDQLSFIFLGVAMVLVANKKWAVFSPVLYAIAANLKPNCILILPIYLAWWWIQKQGMKKLIWGGIGALVFSLWTITWVTDRNLIPFIFEVLLKKLNTSDGLINYNAFNFWYIFFPFAPRTSYLDSMSILGINVKVIGFFGATVSTIWGIKTMNKKMGKMWAAMFVAGFGSWLFLTGMHERYSFLAITPLLLASIENRRLLKYFLILSTIFTFNMFIAHWPWDKIGWMLPMMAANNFLFGRIMSGLNVIVFGLAGKTIGEWDKDKV
ncbi:MAG TPA: hypothetical protein PK045_03040 [Candidatus Woesebacteria bacterium]|nr:hypothetical protein [Candidatus Woesebacteria bacterium]